MAEPLFSYADPAFPWVKRSLIRLIERFTGQPRLKRLYMAHHDNPRPGESFFAAAVRSLELDVRLAGEALSTIPKTGPLVIVANHPYGVLDGIVITWLMETVRKDFKVLTNAVLLRAPEARDYLLPVDFSETPDALATNLATREAARRLLDAGGAVVVFPTGGVSTSVDKLGRGRAIDAPWQPFTAQLIQRSKAAVVPVFFAGQNSRLFQLASHIHLTLRLSLIFKEVRDRIGTVLPVTIGACISPEEIRAFGDRKALMEELRRRTYGLGGLTPYVDAAASDDQSWLRRLLSRLVARRQPVTDGETVDHAEKVY